MLRLLYLILLWIPICVQAQMVDPVHFTSQLITGKGQEAEIIFKAKIDAGWHVYSTNLGQDGPIEASFNVVKMEGAEKVGKLQARGKEIKISTPDSKIDVWVIPTDEEIMIARDTVRLLHLN